MLALRQQYPRWGQDKLVVLRRRGGLTVSPSMVGRILAHLKRRGMLVEPLPVRLQARRSRPVRPYAMRKPLVIWSRWTRWNCGPCRESS